MRIEVGCWQTAPKPALYVSRTECVHARGKMGINYIVSPERAQDFVRSGRSVRFMILLYCLFGLADVLAGA